MTGMKTRTIFRPLLPSERLIFRYGFAPAVLLLGAWLWVECHSIVATLISIGVAAFYMYLGRPQTIRP